VSPLVALKAQTIWSAYQHFEEKTKGSIEAGKLADLVILDQNPMTVDPLTIAQIKVLETIKEGTTVYARGAAQKQGAITPSCASSDACFRTASVVLEASGAIPMCVHGW
jgi:adenine deaminase